ncbi:MAG: MarR family transcriptional regulator [Thiothrix sp.]|nr:MarR family transcriptional regulator [Thiothrix sp.]HPQ96320.1 MarR family transcriptional regulator [Thiolinea sp.]
MRKTDSTPTRTASLQLEDFLPYRLTVAADLISRSLSKVYAGYDITIPEWRVMAQLFRHGSLTPGALGRLANMEKARVTRALILMNNKALITRTPDQHDRRVAYIDLSDKGRSLYVHIEPHIVDWNRKFCGQLGIQSEMELLQLLQGIETWCRKVEGSEHA